MTDNDRRARGEALARKMWGRVPQGDEVSRDLIDITVEHLFGDIWSRPGLAPRDRSMITCAALAVTGRDPQLKAHLKGALANGVTREEIGEMMIHLSHYGGWPAGVAGLRIAKEVFDEADAEG